MALNVTITGDKELSRKLNKLGKAGNIKGRVWNDTPYGPYVQKRGVQARIHQGWWHTDVDVVERQMGRHVKDLEKTVDHILAGRGPTTGNPLRAWMGRVVRWTMGALEKYPPERPNSPYIRTERLKRGWRSKVFK